MDQDTPYSLDKNAAIAVHAGFPNAAADHRSIALNFNQLLMAHPTSTYCFRIEGDRWEDRGVFNGDIAVVDRALHAKQTDLVINWEGEEFALMPFSQTKGIDPWGVVTHIIHQYR